MNNIFDVWDGSYCRVSVTLEAVLTDESAKKQAGPRGPAVIVKPVSENLLR